MPSSFIFNQYYIDCLKRLKTQAKENKSDELCKKVLKSIKDNYVTLDKSSDEYITFVNKQISEEVWESYVEKQEDWLKTNADLELYIGITVADFVQILQDDYLCNHFITVFYIFKKELSDETCSKIVNILQSINSQDSLEDLDNGSEGSDGVETVKKALLNLQTLRNKKVKDKSGIDMKFIEETTLGKLAKEIMEDVDVAKLQKSIGEKGDVLKAIGDPDSGFADIISSVSRKMATKISNGELKQENLIQDAMKFASSMPNMFGGNGSGGSGGSGSGGRSGGGRSQGPDLAGMMSMMSSMMGNNNDLSSMMSGLGGLQGMGNPPRAPKAPKGTRTTVNESALKKIAKAKKLKKKLDSRKKQISEADEGSDGSE